MSIEHINRIKILAQKALEAANCDRPPVPVEKIAQKLEFKIVPFSFDKRISGILKKEEKIIGVNKDHHPLRQRFSISHELGHYLLGHEIETNREDIVDKNFNENTSIEREANLFASALLMPEDWVRENAKKDGLDIKSLAKKFEVSEQAMTIRLLELRLIK